MTGSPVQIGPYAIGQLITEHPDAKKLSWLDRVFQTPKVPGEIVYRTTERFQFLNGSWLMFLGVVQDRIYKLSARWSCDNQPQQEAMLEEVAFYCIREFGDPVRPDAFLWHPPFGVVTIEAKGVTYGTFKRTGLFVISLEAIATLNVGGGTGFHHANN